MPEFKHLLKTPKMREDFEREVEKARLELQKKDKETMAVYEGHKLAEKHCIMPRLIEKRLELQKKEDKPKK